MRVKIKNVDKFKEEITLSGFTLNSLSVAVKKHRSYVNSICKRVTLSPLGAKVICEVLDIKFDKYFELVK